MKTSTVKFTIPLSFVVALVGLLQPTTTFAQYHPKHPKVVEMVNNGIAFLKKEKGPDIEYKDGEDILVGYTILKVTGDTDEPMVKLAIQKAVKMANEISTARHAGESKIIYEASIAAVLLASVDGAQYRPQLDKILYWFKDVQKSHGGFGYLGKKTGDTSQVQYVMLALWSMNEVGVPVPIPMVEDCVRYMRSTMDPSGSWGYQGVIGNGRLVGQDKVSKSLGTAGICGLIIATDILGFYGSRKNKNDKDEGIPDAFKRIDLRDKLRAEKRLVTLQPEFTNGAINAARRYQNQSQFTGNLWYFYWRYSEERYESFVEIVEGRQEKSPPWYNRGVNDLIKLQETGGDKAGAWGVSGMSSFVTSVRVDTSFAILYLIRSTQKSIGKLDSGVTYGGYLLPNDVSNIKMRGEKIVDGNETSVTDLLAMMESDKADVQYGLLPDNLRLADDPVQKKEQVARLARLLSSKDPGARRVAAKLLGRSEDLNQVPELVFALSDPDPKVPLIAEESLRLLSRRLNVQHFSDVPEDKERDKAIKYWKKWYLGLRPDYIFIDD